MLTFTAPYRTNKQWRCSFNHAVESTDDSDGFSALVTYSRTISELSFFLVHHSNRLGIGYLVRSSRIDEPKLVSTSIDELLETKAGLCALRGTSWHGVKVLKGELPCMDFFDFLQRSAIGLRTINSIRPLLQ